MSSTDEELDIEALGRPSFLGQMYNARSGNMLNYTLFPPDAIKAATKPPENSANTINKYEEVRESEVRASLLDVSASVSVSLLGGALKVKGSAAYIDRSDSTQEALAISGIRAITTERKRLEVKDKSLQSSALLTPQKVEQLGATHVITAITYGATMIGSVSETNYSRQKSSDITGQLSIETLKGFGSFTGSDGDAVLTDKDKENISKYDLEVRLVGDFLDSEIPMNAAALSMKLSQAAKLLRVQIPVRLTLTPLGLFNQISAEVFYRDLEKAHLESLIRLYDELVTLTQRWVYQSGVIEQRGSQLFPTLHRECQERTRRAESLLINYRGQLGAFLRDFRSFQGPSSEAATTVFTQGTWLPRIRSEQEAYDSALGLWAELNLIKEYAASGGFPLVSVQSLSATMSEERGPVALVLVPPKCLVADLINMYEGLEKAIRSIKPDTEVNCCSIYADEKLEEDLLLLDGPKQSIRLCLEHSRATSLASLLTHNLLADGPMLVDWKTALQDGWGVQYNPETNTKYVGSFVNGVPHGLGRITYSTGEIYEGSWFRGHRDGPGNLTSGGAVIESGIFVKDVVEDRAVMVNVTVYDDSVPVDAATVAVICHRITPRQPLIEEMKAAIPNQLNKIADALGWQPGQRHRLRTMFEFPRYAVFPAGQHIDDPIYDAEIIPKHYNKSGSSTSVVANGSQLEAFEYDPDNMRLREFGYTLEGYNSLWLNGDIGYQGVEKGNPMSIEIVRNIRELGEPILVDAVRLP